MSNIPNLRYKYNKSNQKNKKKKKIILNTAQDLLNIPKEDFYKINISNLCGKYFDQIYEEALELEQKNINFEDFKSLDSKEYQSDSKTFKSNAKTNYESPIRNSYNLTKKITKISPIKSKNRTKNSHSRDNNKIKKKHNYKIFANDFKEDENSINDNKHIFSPEIPTKINPFEYNDTYSNNELQINNIMGLNPYNQKIENNLTSVFDEIKKNERKKVYISMLEKAYQNGNNPLYNHNIKNEEKVHKKKSNKSKSKSKKNIKNNKIEKIRDNFENKVNKIIFYIKYDSKYGDNIGILGSIDELGNWCQDKILYLRWSKGNVWTGEVEIENDISKFEFKFINRHDGIIYWERGFNNIVDLKGITQELKFQKKGRYNRYEFNYDSEKGELTLTCKIKGWE